MMNMDPVYDAATLVGTPMVGDDGVPLYRFRITSPTIDRQGEIVETDGWEFTNYLKNPVVLNSHEYGDIEAIVGRCVGIERDGDSWVADLRFNSTEYGTLARTLIDDGDLRAVSVGFRPIVIDYPQRQARGTSEAEAVDKVAVNVERDQRTAVRHMRKELLEISVVPVPANPDAIRLRSMNGRGPAAEVATKIVAPEWLRANARRGLAWYADGLAGDGVTAGTVREARAMADGSVSADKATRMAAWFARHMPDLDAPAADPGHPDYPSPGVVAHALWGGGSKTASERAAGWARANSDNQDTQSKAEPPPETDIPDRLWHPIACAMHAVMVETETNDTARRRLYNGLERAYRVLGKEPPDFVAVDTLRRWSTRERDGQFWEDEATVSRKAGRVLSSQNEAMLAAVIVALDTMSMHITEAMSSWTNAKVMVETILSSTAVPDGPSVVPPDAPADQPTDQPADMPQYKAEAEWEELRKWLRTRE